ncbi:MAG TPA: hypothetical protein VFF06_36130, partial [Polyangia bacterium]|nr:hypothetical protein [Polyangia bacterium]
MYALLPYGTLAMTVGLALARPRLWANVRLGPAAAGLLGVTLLVAARIIGRAELVSASASLWRPLT